MPRDRRQPSGHAGAAAVPRWRAALALLALVVGALAVWSGSPGRADTADGAPLLLAPVADATVTEKDPESNRGAGTKLSSDRAPELEALVRFDVPTLSAPVRRATLRLFVTNGTSKAPNIHTAASDWDESSITWSSRPPAGAMVAGQDRLRSRSWVEYDVTAAVAGEGPLALALVPRSSDGAAFSSREVSGQGPELVMEMAEDTTTTVPTAEDTSTSTVTQPAEDTTTTATATVEDPTTTTTTTTTVPAPGASCSSRWGTAKTVSALPGEVTEVSGLVPSQAYPGWGWMIRDSDNPASLYSVHLNEEEDATVHEFPVPGAKNSDWEDVAYTTGADGRGVLWVLENTGNSWRGNRTIYQVQEPDPTRGGPATLLGRHQFAYPDTQSNTEILFAFDGDLVLISKTSTSRVYRFTKPLAAQGVNVPVYVGALDDGSVLTWGALSPDRRFLAVGNYSTLKIFENRGALSDLASLIAHGTVHEEALSRDDREGGSFFPAGSCDLVVVAESTNIWNIANG